MNKRRFSRRFIRLILFICFLIGIGIGGNFISQANQHGYQFNIYNPYTIINNMNKTPLRDDMLLRKELKSLEGKVIVLYSFDCSDCHESYKFFKPYLDDINVLFVPIESEVGEVISLVYTIDQVPSAIYFNDYADPMIRPLFYKSFNYQNWHDILDESGYSKEDNF